MILWCVFFFLGGGLQMLGMSNWLYKETLSKLGIVITVLLAAYSCGCIRNKVEDIS